MIISEQEQEQYEKYPWSIDIAIDMAEKEGMEVVRSSPTKILLDLDDGAALDKYTRMIGILAQHFGLVERERWFSKSGKGVHVVVECKEMGFAGRVCLQACLGSDSVREGLGLAMSMDGHKEPSVLFRPKTIGNRQSTG